MMQNSSNLVINDSHIRLFLSVDVEGSSALKSSQNHMVLLRIYKDLIKSLDELERDELIEKKFDVNDPTRWLPSILRSFPREEWDWASILTSRFADFHVLFTGELQKSNFFQHENDPHDSSDIDLVTRRHLWKLLGDELIYSFRIKSRKLLHDCVSAFLNVLRDYDKLDLGKNVGIRIKGTGWIAGFPVRNRIVELPAPELFWQDHSKQYHPYDYPKIDYLGPEMDTGFRISKFAHPGLLACSIELAELLGQVGTTRQLRGAIVGWEVLKGVWKERPYPIIWVVPNNHPNEGYGQFFPWSKTVNPLVKTWTDMCENNQIRELKDLSETLCQTRSLLSSSLGVVAPYIPQEREEEFTQVDPDHRILLELLSALPQSDESRKEQGVGKEPPKGTDLVTPESTESLLNLQ